jgi:hypothetical protein
LICECSNFDVERAHFWASLGTQQPLSQELAWTKYLDFTTASDVYITTVDKAFEVITSTSLRGAYASLNFPAEDPEAFRSSLRDTARWVLADLRSEMDEDDK